VTALAVVVHLGGSVDLAAVAAQVPAPKGTDAPVAGWSEYATAVDPGSSIDFVNSQTGWRVDGQLWGQRIDENLASGPGGIAVDWPGTAVSRSTDGGKDWSTALRVSTGIWGGDLLSPQVGYVVEVTALRRTTDGGRSWTAVREPSGHPLVWVHFSSAERGYGLTTVGGLVSTVNGGSSWRTEALPAPGIAACFSSSEAGYVVGGSGDVYATSNGGTSWVNVRRAPRLPAGFGAPWAWASVSCQGTSVVVGLQVFCAAACGAENPYLVEVSGNSGQSWSGIASEWPKASGGKAQAAVFGAVSVAPKGPVVVDLPTAGFARGAFDVEVLVGSAAQGAYKVANVPALPASPMLSQITYDCCHVSGVMFSGRTGWLYLDDRAAGSPEQQSAEAIVWKTDNGGLSWKVVSVGPKQERG
jgi:photosystem II stability/assembly factor-like uncharacterized protein